MSDMNTPRTCGQGLAQNSTLPAQLAELIDAVGGVLETHIKALDLTDPTTNDELDTYRQLANAHRNAAAQLHTIATQMADARDLAMGKHNPEVMAAPAAMNAFETLVRQERQLASLLDGRLEAHRQMLDQMRAAGSRSRGSRT
jgi:hypothetical protein